MSPERIEQLEQMAKIVASMFKAADAEGLFIGMGYDPGGLQQEGPKVRKLRKLSVALEKPNART